MSKKINLYFLLLITVVISSSITYIITAKKFNKLFRTSVANNHSLLQPVSLSCESKSVRLKGYKYIQPLVFGDKVYESGKFNDLKKQIEDYLNQLKQQGILSEASVYLKNMKGGDWFCINENVGFNPGSLIKVPILITFLKMEEDHPGLLNKKLTFTSRDNRIPAQTFNTNQIQQGKSYTIKELLKYMIAFSDNNATYLLNKDIDLTLFRKLFTDLDMPEPPLFDNNYLITTKEYSGFFKLIFNAGYLNINNSEFAAELLSECDFTQGMVQGIPENTPIAHKFGETAINGIHQLHESGFIYLDNSAFLLTVMTKGRDVLKLPEFISTVTKLSYNKIKAKEVAMN